MRAAAARAATERRDASNVLDARAVGNAAAVLDARHVLVADGL